jgi:hypothetical protein
LQTRRTTHSIRNRALRPAPLPPCAAAAHKRDLEDLQEEIAGLREERNRYRRSVSEAAQVQRKLGAPRQLRRHALEFADEVFPMEQVCGIS